LDSGRGGAELWTSRAVDREEHPQLLVQVVVADAGKVAATNTVTVIIDDVNDNPMKPASKTVYLWKTQGGGSDAPLGRVYVKDPDDWDLGDKTFRWVGSPHPLFSLNTQDGTIFASSQVREGRYELHFSVSDRVWRQRGVSANVTVAEMLTQDALSHAAPITLTPTTPTDLTRGWTPMGGGGLGRLVDGVLKVVVVATLSRWSVCMVTAPPTTTPPTPTLPVSPRPPSRCTRRRSRSCCVLLLSRCRLRQPVCGSSKRQREVHGPRQASGATGPPLPPGVVGRRLEEIHSPDLRLDLQNGDDGDPSSAASLASTALPLQVVDTNATSLVTPRLTRAHACHAHEPETCTPTSCLNGGRCVRSSDGNRCICPGGSKGWQCKVLARTFTGSGWAWVRPLPPCLPTTISLRLLTRHPNALILYSGPLAPQQRPAVSPPMPTPMLALQLKFGRPQLLFEGGLVPLKLEVNTTVHDGDWHTLHVHLDAQGVALMVDLCGRGWEKHHSHDDAHCLARAAWTIPWGLEGWLGSGPLQVGGLAHTPPTAHDHEWEEAPTARPLHGCISHLTLNGQLVDLGEPAYSRESSPGCLPQESACPGGLGGCSVRGECVGGLRRPECECEPGWTGSGCNTPTVPAALGKASYMKVALSFTPAPRVLRVQVRLRTRGARHGLLLHLAAHHHSAAFTLHLRSSVACASLTGSEWAARVACVEGRPLGDGSWHTVRAERHGDNLVVSVDDGDGWRRNESLASFLVVRERRGHGREAPTPLNVDKHDGVTVGGLPEFVACVDDLRVSGRHLPLPPAINGTSWGQVTTLQHLERGCDAPDACVNITCTPPLSCNTTWGQPTCSCGPGRQLVDRNCEDVDECVWRPCLHGGTCHNLRPGYMCMCGPGHTGDHCQWATLTNTTNSLTAPVAIAALTVSLLVLLVVGLVVSIRLHRHRTNLGLRERPADDDTGKNTVVEVQGDEGGGGGKGEKKIGEDDTHESFLECLKFKLPTSQPALKKKGSPVPGGSDPTAGGEARGAPDPLLPRDDLRAYAYEGDGSSSGSFTSTISADLKVDMAEEDSTIVPLVPEFLEVMDLLRNLPEAANKTTFGRTKSTSNLKKGSGSPSCTKEPLATASSIVMVKGGGSSKQPSTVRTRISHLSPSRYKSEGTSKTDVVLGKSEGEVSTVC
ncbi:neural-cadherin 2-like 6, partial [Homarus americanus]